MPKSRRYRIVSHAGASRSCTPTVSLSRMNSGLLLMLYSGCPTSRVNLPSLLRVWLGESVSSSECRM